MGSKKKTFSTNFHLHAGTNLGFSLTQLGSISVVAVLVSAKKRRKNKEEKNKKRVGVGFKLV